ncbi:hypothetical protein H5410_051224, partial [Solanum commersonii]
FKYFEFEAKHRHYLAKRNKTTEKTKKRRNEDRLMHWANRRMALTLPKVQSVHRQTVLRSSTISPNDPEREDDEGKS